MSETPTPALLSTERLAEIEANAESWQRTHIANLAFRYGADVPDLLADRAAYRQRVATELAGLLIAPNSEEGWRGRDYWQGVRDTTARITAAASRLGIDLSLNGISNER